jgi:hypothetical protein
VAALAVLVTEWGAVVKVVPTISPKATLNNVVGILSRSTTNYTFVVVTGKDSLTKLVTREQLTWVRVHYRQRSRWISHGISMSHELMGALAH